MSDAVIFTGVVAYLAGAVLAGQPIMRWYRRMGIPEHEGIAILLGAAFGWPITLFMMIFIAAVQSVFVFIWLLLRPNTYDPLGAHEEEKEDPK